MIKNLFIVSYIMSAKSDNMGKYIPSLCSSYVYGIFVLELFIPKFLSKMEWGNFVLLSKIHNLFQTISK